jgi:hypothetical protein
MFRSGWFMRARQSCHVRSSALTALLLLLALLPLACGTGTPLNRDGDVVILTDDNFDGAVSNGVWMVDVFATWCAALQHKFSVHMQQAPQMPNPVRICVTPWDTHVHWPCISVYLRHEQHHTQRFKLVHNLVWLCSLKQGTYLCFTHVPVCARVCRCVHCQQLEPMWKSFAAEMRSNGVNVAKACGTRHEPFLACTDTHTGISITVHTHTRWNTPNAGGWPTKPRAPTAAGCQRVPQHIPAPGWTHMGI